MNTDLAGRAAGWPLTDGTGEGLTSLLGSLPAAPRLLGLGEPTHGVEEFPLLRNEFFRELVVRHGYRSIALESDCLAALAVDDYVTEGAGERDEVLRRGFSHGFGALAANRELVDWLRRYNRDRPPGDRVRYYGIDAPMEITGARSPRPSLRELHRYLATNLDGAVLPCTGAAIDELAGDDDRWSDPAAMVDASRSVGGTPEAHRLRELADALLALLTGQSARLVAATSADAWWRANLHGRTAAGLLRYHATLADPDESRIARGLGLRDAMMAGNLAAVLDREAGRGPVLVFAHNRHLQRELSTWRLGEHDLAWWSAGSIIGTRLGNRYAFIASALGAAPAHGIGAPGGETLEGRLAGLPERRYLFDSARLAATLPELPRRTGVPAGSGYFPFDPAHLADTDGLLFVREAG